MGSPGPDRCFFSSRSRRREHLLGALTFSDRSVAICCRARQRIVSWMRVNALHCLRISNFRNLLREAAVSRTGSVNLLCDVPHARRQSIPTVNVIPIRAALLTPHKLRRAGRPQKRLSREGYSPQPPQKRTHLLLSLSDWQDELSRSETPSLPVATSDGSRCARHSILRAESTVGDERFSGRGPPRRGGFVREFPRRGNPPCGHWHRRYRR
jgi:hypothetical protein